MLIHAPVPEPGHDPALAAARVVESAVDLVRAEAKLAFVHARAALVKTVGALLAVMLATSAAQVALLLSALSPVLFTERPPSAVLVALGPSVCLTGLGAWLAFAAWQSLRRGSSAAAQGTK